MQRSVKPSQVGATPTRRTKREFYSHDILKVSLEGFQRFVVSTQFNNSVLLYGDKQMCGICGSVSAHPIGLESIVKQLTRVNHRGHEAVGIAAVNASGRSVLPLFVAPGSAREACNANQPEFREFSERFLANQPCAFIGHTRYSTVGPSNMLNAQPIRMRHPTFGEFYLAHNGQVPDHKRIREQLEKQGQRFASESDSETLAAVIAHCPAQTLPEAVTEMTKRVEGAFSLLVLGQKHFVAARDRYGFWSLWMGTAQNGDKMFASEEGSLDLADSTQEIGRGMIVSLDITRKDKDCFWSAGLASPKRCWLDIAYLSRPDEGLGDTTVSNVRFVLGQKLAESCPVSADLVTGVPDSGIDAARGFAQTSGIPLSERAMVRNRWAPGRSFILPGQIGRRNAVREKQSITRRIVSGKSVVVIDDSVVRSTTAGIITEMMRAAGAREVHWRIAAAPIRYPCFYGIDMPSTDQLPAHSKSVSEIAADIKADSLCYLPLEVMHSCLNRFQNGWCTACVTCDYPIAIR